MFEDKLKKMKVELLEIMHTLKNIKFIINTHQVLAARQDDIRLFMGLFHPFTF